MKKKIQVILLEDHIKKEKKGSLINVNRGYAFNYLIPNNIAEIATENKIKHINMINKMIKNKEKTQEIETKLLRNSIEKIQHLSIYKQQGENNFIFGNITDKEISKWINRYTNLIINKIKLEVLETKMIGIKLATVEIDKKITINLPIYIIPINI